MRSVTRKCSVETEHLCDLCLSPRIQLSGRDRVSLVVPVAIKSNARCSVSSQRLQIAWLDHFVLASRPLPRFTYLRTGYVAEAVPVVLLVVERQEAPMLMLHDSRCIRSSNSRVASSVSTQQQTFSCVSVLRSGLKRVTHQPSSSRSLVELEPKRAIQAAFLLKCDFCCGVGCMRDAHGDLMRTLHALTRGAVFCPLYNKDLAYCDT